MDGDVAGAIIGAGGAIAAAVIARVTIKRSQKSEKRLASVVEGLSGLPPGAPKAFFEEAAYVQGIRLCRQDCVVRLWFRRSTENRLEVETEMSFTLVNFSETAEKYTLTAMVIPDRLDEDARILRLAGTGRDLLGQSFDHVYPVEAASETRAKQDIMIPPNRVGADNRITLRFREYAYTSDSDVIYMSAPTLGVTVQIEERPPELTVALQFGHRKHGEAEAFLNGWRLREVFLPFQSVHIYWHD